LKGTHPRIIPTRFGLIWFRGFRGEDLNVKVYNDGCQLMTKAQNELKKKKKRIHHRIIDIFSPQITSVI
jgi:methionine salvage enolase-phosphatase E1